MTVLIVFLLGCFVVGGSRWGTWAIDRRLLFLGVSIVFAASFYSLRVVL